MSQFEHNVREERWAWEEGLHLSTRWLKLEAENSRSGKANWIIVPGKDNCLRKMGPRHSTCWGVLRLGLCSPWARCKRGCPRQAPPMLTSHLLSFRSPGEDTNSRSDGHRWHQGVFVQAHPQPRHRPDQVPFLSFFKQPDEDRSFSANQVRIDNSLTNRWFPQQPSEDYSFSGGSL